MIHTPGLLLLLAVAATARATLLITEDTITEPLRDWVAAHRPARQFDLIEDPATGEQIQVARPDRLVYLLGCPWCMSVWVGAVVAALTYWCGRSWPVQIGLIALTASLVTGLLAQVKGRL